MDYHQGMYSDMDPDLLPPLDHSYLDDEEYMEGYYGDEGYDNEGEFPYDYHQYQQYLDDDEMYYSRISVSELLDQCVFPTISQAITTIYPLLGLCFVCRITAWFCSEVPVMTNQSRLGKGLVHCCSALTGLIALHCFFQENLLFLVMLSVLAYGLLHVASCKCKGFNGIIVAVVTVVYLLTCELFVVKEEEWHRIRGAQMVLAMKIISLAFDLDSGSVQQLPGLLEYSGYVFHVGSVVFGPWLSYHDYSQVASYKDRKMDFYWVFKLLCSASLSISCVVVSTCVVHWLVLDGSFIWLLAFRDAQSFRFSHYFVSFLSELTVTLSGLGTFKTNGDVRWDLTVSKLYHVEIPRSLVEVVSNWNLPMHYWLKNYVFRMAKPAGTFPAILLTYAASSILHGLNFQLASVLLSLGVYSYIEFMVRDRLSRAFSACIQAKRCKPDCNHNYKSNHVYVILTNLWFGLLTIFHLSYLGLMFDTAAEQQQGYSMAHTLSKWTELGYASHWVALATYIFYLLV